MPGGLVDLVGASTGVLCSNHVVMSTASLGSKFATSWSLLAGSRSTTSVDPRRGMGQVDIALGCPSQWARFEPTRKALIRLGHHSNVPHSSDTALTYLCSKATLLYLIASATLRCGNQTAGLRLKVVLGPDDLD